MVVVNIVSDFIVSVTVCVAVVITDVVDVIVVGVVVVVAVVVVGVVVVRVVVVVVGVVVVTVVVVVGVVVVVAVVVVGVVVVVVVVGVVVVVVVVVVIRGEVTSCALALSLTASIKVMTGGVTTPNRPHCSKNARLSALRVSSSRASSVTDRSSKSNFQD